MLALAFPEQSGTAAHRRVGWVFATLNCKGQLEFIRAFPYDLDDRAARIPGLTGLSAAKVVFVGCGCLGSKVAVSLAASGLGALTLIDADTFEPYNAVRHEVGVPSFGFGSLPPSKKGHSRLLVLGRHTIHGTAEKSAKSTEK